MADDSNQVNGHVTNCSSSDSSSSSSESDSEGENELSYETLLANSQFIAQAYKNCKQKLKDAMMEISKLKLSQSSSSDSHNLPDYDTERTNLLSEIEKLKKENEVLTKDLLKFTSSSSIMNKLLTYGRTPFNRSGLNFDPDKEVNKNPYNIPASICRRCGVSGHIEVACKAPPVSGIKTQNKRGNRPRNRSKPQGKTDFPKNKFSNPIQQKRVKPNKKGPKKIWVPKSQIVFVADILNRKAEDFKLVPGQWMLATYDRKPIYVPRHQTK